MLERLWARLQFIFKHASLSKGNPPLLPLISPSPTLSLSFIHFAGCTAKGFFATCEPSCSFRETNRKQIKRHICVCLYTEGRHYFSLPGWIQTPHAPPACPRCLKWTSMPWWLWWNLISGLQADCILLSCLCVYFGPNGGVNLNTPMRWRVIWGYTHGHLGPSFLRAERVQRGHKRPSDTFLHPFLLSQLSQALTA